MAAKVVEAVPEVVAAVIREVRKAELWLCVFRNCLDPHKRTQSNEGEKEQVDLDVIDNRVSSRRRGERLSEGSL